MVKSLLVRRAAAVAVGAFGVVAACRVITTGFVYDIRHEACRRAAREIVIQESLRETSTLGTFCTEERTVSAHLVAFAGLLTVNAFMVGRRLWSGARKTSFSRHLSQ